MAPLIILGEYDPAFEPHVATDRAIAHSCRKNDLDLDYAWLSTQDISPTLWDNCHGLWVAPGSPYRDLDKTLEAIHYARGHNVPTLGTCGGFQHMVLEFAQNVLGFADARHAEYDPYASRLFISRLACSLTGRDMHLQFTPDSQVARIYGSTRATEQYYCDFGVNPEFVSLLKSRSLSIVGADAEGEVRVIEYPEHPFFIGTLYVPQARSTEAAPHPLVSAFLEAILNRSQSG